MSIGCSIYFTPVDRSWIGTPDFVRRIAALFGATAFESLHLWQIVPDSTGDPWDDQILLLELPNPLVEEAVSKMRGDRDFATILTFASADDGLLMTMTDAALAAMPAKLSEDFVPLDVSVHLGRWEVYDQGGDFRDAGLCCVELGNSLGYPIETQRYLQCFLAVPEVARFQTRLEELSAQPWEALIELT